MGIIDGQLKKAILFLDICAYMPGGWD